MIFRIKVILHQLVRYLLWTLWFPGLARRRLPSEEFGRYHLLLFEHSSPVIRKYPGVDPGLQHNKVFSLNAAVRRLQGLLVRPGETFSFCYSVGRPTRTRGFQEGLEFRNGRQTSGIGGGICQLSNMLHWAALNLGLQVLERHRHGFDLFPDDHRRIPFGAGATVFYNYRDLRFCNTTGIDLLFTFDFHDERIRLRIRSDRPLPYRIEIVEREDLFYEREGITYRRNLIEQFRVTGSGMPPGSDVPPGSAGAVGSTDNRVKTGELRNECEVRYSPTAR